MNSTLRTLAAHALLLSLAVPVSIAPFAEAAALPAPEKESQDQLAFIDYVLGRAANEFGNVKAADKQIQAARQLEIATALNTVTVTAGVSHSFTATNYSKFPAANSSTTANTFQAGATVTGSLATIFTIKGLDLKRDALKSSREALQMQNVLDAAGALSTYMNSASRVNLLGAYVTILTNIQKDPESARKLSAGNQAILGNLISSYRLELATVGTTRDLAAVQIEKYTDAQTVRRLKEMMLKSETQSSSSSSQKGFDWADIDRYFQVPAKVEDALAYSRRAPVLVQSDLAEKMARNDWRAAAATLLPTVSASVGRNMGNGTSTSLGTTFGSPLSGKSATVAMSMAIGGGAAFNLSALSLLKEAAGDTTGAAKKTVIAQMQSSYLTLDATRKQLETMDQILKAFTTQGVSFNPHSDTQFETLVSKLAMVDTFSQNALAGIGTLMQTRIQIHALMGTLLDKIKSPTAPLPPLPNGPAGGDEITGAIQTERDRRQVVNDGTGDGRSAGARVVGTRSGGGATQQGDVR